MLYMLGGHHFASSETVLRRFQHLAKRFWKDLVVAYRLLALLQESY